MCICLNTSFYIDLHFKSANLLNLKRFEAMYLIKFFLSQWVLSDNLTTPKMGKQNIVYRGIYNNVLLNQSEELQQHQPPLAGAFLVI